MYRVFKKDEPDTLIHMAGEVGRMVGEEHPQKMIFVNNTGVLNLIKLCLEYNTRLVYFSTSEVYGHLFDKKLPVKEGDLEAEGSSFITTNIYALSKLFGEAIVKHYVDNYDLNAVAVRPFMIYGRGEYPSMYRSAITNFVYKALNGEKLTVHEGAVRAWCNINDFVEGVRLVTEHPFSGRYEAFNVGSDEYHTMEEVARIAVEEASGIDDQIELVKPPDKFLSLVKIASIDKARQIGYSPRVALKDGIHSVAEWQREEIMSKGKP
jgi:nucleoside-diphosphate-sugar epimerase